MGWSRVPDVGQLAAVWDALPGDAARAANWGNVSAHVPKGVEVGQQVQTADGLHVVTGMFRTRTHLRLVFDGGAAGADAELGGWLLVRTWRRLSTTALETIDYVAGEGDAAIAARVKDERGRRVAVTRRTAAGLELRALVVVADGRVRLTDAGEACYAAHREVQ